jgi:anti-sigma regulatory factor (Ser/Thr protein kinase)
MTARRSFGWDRASVAASRKFLTDTLADLPDDLRESAVLMMSELATNAVVHANTGFVVSVERTSAQVRVEVTDIGKGEPKLRTPSASEPHGRGLRIVKELSDEWGMVEDDDRSGKTVWYVVRLDPAFQSEVEASASKGDPQSGKDGRTVAGRREGASAGGNRAAESGRGPQAHWRAHQCWRPNPCGALSDSGRHRGDRRGHPLPAHRLERARVGA